MALIARGSCTGDGMRRLIGVWTWPMLVRRLSLSAFSSVYRFCACAGSKEYQLWPSVVRELLTVVGLAPLLSSRLGDSWSPSLVAVDASKKAGGIVAAKLGGSKVSALGVQRPRLGKEVCERPPLSSGQASLRWIAPRGAL